MTPLFFGERTRQLFGVYSAGQTAARRFAGKRAVVLCPPWGQEYLRSHRAMRRLAVSLAAVGFDVLRFDYYGTGDSAGDTVDVTLSGCEQDIQTAMDELKDMVGVPRIGLMGLRLGGTLAARIAARRAIDVDRLLMWDPISHGSDYLNELLNVDPRPAPRPAALGGGHQVQGFPLLATQAKEIAAATLPDAPPDLLARSLLLRSMPGESGSSGFPEELLPGPSAWCEEADLGAGAVPVELIARIVNWAQT